MQITDKSTSREEERPGAQYVEIQEMRYAKTA